MEETADTQTTKAEENTVYPDFQAAGLENVIDRLQNSDWQSAGYDLEQLDLDTIYAFDTYAVGQPLDEEGNIDEEADPIEGQKTDKVRFLL